MRLLIAPILVAGFAALCEGEDKARFAREQQEHFLKTAKVIRTASAPGGITGSLRATLSDGNLTHDAHIQAIDESKAQYATVRGTELNFRDSYKYNIAAYRLDRLLELNMVPVTVERKHAGKTSSFTWWVDDVLMDEGKRLKTKTAAPDIDDWNHQMFLVRLFDQLIYNTDRNLGNLLITKDWRIWMIDHTRAFRLLPGLPNQKNLSKCDRGLLDRLKSLTAERLQAETAGILTKAEVKSLLERRDKIVAFFENAGAEALFARRGRED